MTTKEKNIAAAVLAEITAKKVAPRPRWHFVLRNVLVWIAAGILVVIGAIAVSVIIFAFTYGAWNVHGALGQGVLQHVLTVLPLMWIIAFGVFVVIAEYAIRTTKKGYRYSLPVLSLILFGASVMGGIALHAAGGSALADEILGVHVPHYRTVEMRQNRLLYSPEKGRIFGVVETVEGQTFILYNFVENDDWVVEGAMIPSEKQDLVREGAAIMVVGEHVGDDQFAARDVFPVAKPRGAHHPTAGAPPRNGSRLHKAQQPRENMAGHEPAERDHFLVQPAE